MKLFYQLEEKQQNDVLHYCANMVMQDMINDGVRLEPITEEEQDLKLKLEEAIEYTKTLSSNEEKIDYLLSDPAVSKAIYEIALEMSKGAFYHEEGELVLYPSEISKEDPEEHLLPEAGAGNKKKISNLN